LQWAIGFRLSFSEAKEESSHVQFIFISRLVVRFGFNCFGRICRPLDLFHIVWGFGLFLVLCGFDRLGLYRYNGVLK
jgi:hypothetical protein